jgi:hypothetical protein
MDDPLLEKRVEEAFRTVPPTETEIALIRALLDNPGLRSKDLAAVMGWQGDAPWHLHFGGLCKRRSEFLPTAPTTDLRQDRDGQPSSFWSGILADLDSENRFTMKPEAERAFRKLGV